MHFNLFESKLFPRPQSLWHLSLLPPISLSPVKSNAHNVHSGWGGVLNWSGLYEQLSYIRDPTNKKRTKQYSSQNLCTYDLHKMRWDQLTSDKWISSIFHFFATIHFSLRPVAFRVGLLFDVVLVSKHTPGSRNMAKCNKIYERFSLHSQILTNNQSVQIQYAKNFISWSWLLSWTWSCAFVDFKPFSFVLPLTKQCIALLSSKVHKTNICSREWGNTIGLNVVCGHFHHLSSSRFCVGEHLSKLAEYKVIRVKCMLKGPQRDSATANLPANKNFPPNAFQKKKLIHSYSFSLIYQMNQSKDLIFSLSFVTPILYYILWWAP